MGLFRVVMVAVAALVAASTPASATSTGNDRLVDDPETGSATVLLDPTEPMAPSRDMQDLRGRYGSLSAALLSLHTSRDGQSAAALLGDETVTDALFGAGPIVSDVSVFDRFGPGDGDLVNSALATIGVVTDWRDSDNMFHYAQLLSQQSGSVESRTVAAGQQWAVQLAELHTPLLPQPGLEQPTIDGYAALPVGLFTERATTVMVTDFPDVFAAVSSSGIGSAEAGAAWRASMNHAYAATEQNLLEALPNPCYGLLMHAMASGDPGGGRTAGTSDCGSCAATGLYLNGHLSRLFDPQIGSTLPDVTDQLIPPAEFNALQPWQRQAVIDANPSLGTGVDSVVGGSPPATGCGGDAATNVTQSMLPGVFEQLRSP